jgi:mRNA-degrading endonuclease RelE of RelBE toxin-antitoxin system
MIFIEDHNFEKRRRGLLDDDEYFEFLGWLMIRPQLGAVVPGSGGLRKVRWAAKGRGKRGGLRVIYFWWTADDRILLLDIYSKSAKEDLTPAEIEKLRKKAAR